MFKGLNPCLNDSSICDPLASCNYSTKHRTSWQKACKCPVGYAGDGIKKSIMRRATGCRNMDACLSTGLLQCVPEAECVDAKPPSLEISDCVCP